MIRFFMFCSIWLVTISQSYGCNQICGAGETSKKVSYPFGFSSGCPVQLNCTENGIISINEFQVETFQNGAILVRVPANCDRPIITLRHLFGTNFAPTSHNGILLRNCSRPITGCLIPSTTVQTNFELLDCGSSLIKGENISCYSETDKVCDYVNKFYVYIITMADKNIDTTTLKFVTKEMKIYLISDTNKAKPFTMYEDVIRSGCGALFSSISVEGGHDGAVSLGVQVVKLGWWVEGECNEVCGGGKGTTCENIVSPVNGRGAVRCSCKDGYGGDGFRSGTSCWKGTSTCALLKYLSGQCNGKSGIGALVGGLIVAICLILCVGLLFYSLRNHSYTSHKMLKKLNSSEFRSISIPIHSYKEIEKATNLFSDKQCLGSGAYGTVYAGKLNNEWVAIKRIKYRGTDCIKQVLNEIKLLSSVNHPNLVRLLGCSIENGEQILVYEYMPNGTLSEHLQRERSGGLLWPIRLDIATETAQAIAYLHSTDPPIYHRDIKTSNILLDFSYKSKVADFGLSRLGMTETFNSHISTAPQGTPGYVDPQYHQNFQLSDKSDVYSFGVVLVEIMTAMKVVDFDRPENEINLASLAIDRIGKGRLLEIIDPFVDPDSDRWTISSLHKVAELVFRCLAFDKELRPTMMEVAAELERIKNTRWPDKEATELEQIKSNKWPDKVAVPSAESYSCSSLSNDLWLSEESSPSSNCLLDDVIDETRE